MIKSLKVLNNPLSYAENQLATLENTGTSLPRFKDKLENIGFFPLTPIQVENLQINVGKMCNQVCKHCHVDAGPDRKEIMTWETMESCLKVAALHQIKSIDITGGAPEMNPNFRRFIEKIRAVRRDVEIIVRCNLTIILANKKYNDLPLFFKEHNITVVSSLPYFEAKKTDSQRGDGVFEKSIKALQMLNRVGYGQENSKLMLHLVYNPSGAFLPGSQEDLKQKFKSVLAREYNIVFNDLFAITNLPISRFLDYLLQSGNYEDYMEKLVDAFNPSAVPGVMCRNTISVGWDGYLYDCDFNQMLELKVNVPSSKHIGNFDALALDNREIVINEHCYGCTAGSGSSCGGATV
jgi:radical SAM/Cys-rich protein